ncbi:MULTISPECIES: amidohydrolase [Stenotrophomonas]|jgi:imidazolonepropionase-like amidohydrolase|uniref:Amidohydrolase n=1 Tax=Stenotrophomonas bentonitica TaxID=1450134 RepID=A0ABU9JI46_9GAMM|nr:MULTISPECIES: amidohydrolase [Stenotrophomonas]AOX61872.1 amidohydrolase [Stenotrophomonas sp. LM091]MCX2920114.1 amidohydrolase [Stenotrophomonas rhizophila]MDX5514192.1 amidohydrolase [Stenotrophomonas sp. RG-453]HAU82231.1 amidohydrolase [Stenotrophomonas sp.]
MQKLLSVGVGLALMSIVSAPAPAASRFLQDPYPSTYAPIASAPVLISNATVLTGTGVRLDNADVLLRDGRIAAVGTGLTAPADAVRVDGQGKWVTPGIIDVHSHLGVYPSPGVSAHSDGNEMTAPVTANVWAEHSVWPQDPGFAAALAGGVTSMQVLPGSANLVGGRGVTLKNVPATTYQSMKFPGAPWGLKMACGENPKRVYGGKGTAPGTRMGNVAGYRAAFIDASEYIAKNTPKQPKKKRWFSGDDKGDSAGDSGGKRDLKLDTLAGAIQGDIRVHIHCYRADEMATMLDLSKEFGFKIAAFHHAVEAYKLADRLAEEGVCGALWADWWGFKMEAFDGIQENIALVDRPANSCAIVHSDSPEGIQRLNQEAAKVIANARRAGIEIAPERAMMWLTSNAARSLGVETQTGSLEAGKMGDVVVWNGSPFSSYALAEKVYVDGHQVYDRQDVRRQPLSDFMLGQEARP